MASVGGADLELLVSILLWISTFTSCKVGGGEAYDYIIIGGGTAGCPLAATLSKKFSVLLLARGGTPFGNVNVSFMQNFRISLADTSPKSASQVFISTDGVFNSRARILGGGTCINAGFYSKASSRHFKIAVQKLGWDAKLVNESYRWIEKQIVQRPKLAPWQKALKDSLLENGVSPYNGYTLDHVHGTKVGGTIFERNGLRHTVVELLASANLDKLHVLIHATVQKIVFDLNGKKPRTIGVIFKDENGMQHQAVLSKESGSEVILSSGMSDNPMNLIYVPTSQPVEQSLVQTVGITKMGVYIEASSGFGQSSGSIHWDHGLVTAESKEHMKQSNPTRKEKEISYMKHLWEGFVLEKVARPLSTGHLNLLKTNVDDNPSITFNYFSHPSDLQRCVDGVRHVEKISRSKHFKNYMECDGEMVEKLLNMSVQANVNLVPKDTNDTESLKQFCKYTVNPIWHYHGGCHVGKVVGPDYLVLRVERLRVIDGSTFTKSPGTNPQATVMMMGRFMGMKILREREIGKSSWSIEGQFVFV
ncbi:HOTHEAD-like [Olea europaea subsp. europaea]|uniref:HOTHEAD-like n=1 Tax=Olea europaea subsp. europaea TaxID=158383 RepID=A0A8S0U3H3_OLEEU|nr:HOTHEAD-like [Olea europaea subsp. europaea]